MTVKHHLGFLGRIGKSEGNFLDQYSYLATLTVKFLVQNIHDTAGDELCPNDCSQKENEHEKINTKIV